MRLPDLKNPHESPFLGVVLGLLKTAFFLLSLLLLAACGSQGIPSPVPEPSATPSPAPQAESTVIVGATPLVVPAQISLPTVTAVVPSATPTLEPTGMPLQPFVTAEAFRFDSWSPDGDWLAYWLLPQAGAAGAAATPPPAVLHFRQVSTGQECAVPEIPWEDQGEPLVWQPGGNVIINQAAGVWQGIPCQGDFTQLPAPAAEVVGPSALTPSGTYRAETSVLDSSVGILSLETRILALPDNQVVNAVEWKLDERLGEVGLGGEWLAGNQFLIYETLDQGPLLITVSGEVISVAQDLFQVEEIPTLMDPSGFSLRADGSALQGSDDYHIALYGVGMEANFPPVRLYHSETGQVEEMPFNYLWTPGFSPDGRWLLLDERPVRDGYEAYALWVRPVDPAGSEVSFFAAGSPNTLWSPGWDRVAFSQPGSVAIYSFPEGSLIGSWTTGDYETVPAAWSPGGDALAAVGYLPGEEQQALFILKLEN